MMYLIQSAGVQFMILKLSTRNLTAAGMSEISGSVSAINLVKQIFPYCTGTEVGAEMMSKQGMNAAVANKSNKYIGKSELII